MENFEQAVKNINEKIYTLDQANKILEQLETAEKLVFQKATNVALEKSLSSLKELVELPSKVNKDQRPEDLAKYLHEIRDYLRGLTVCKLTVAFEASPTFLKKVANFIETAAKKKVLLDVSENEKIIAGAVLEISGEYRDYSIATTLDKAILSGDVRI